MLSLILLALAIGIILARTLLQNRRSRWQQSPYLLTANTPLAERRAEEDDAAPPRGRRKPPHQGRQAPRRTQRRRRRQASANLARVAQ